MGASQKQRQETMTSSERMQALEARKRPDRVPFIPFIFGFCAKNVGYPIKALYEDPEKSYWSQLWTAEMFGYDASPLYGYASFGGWEFGGDIKMPESEWESAPVVSRFPVRTPEDVEALKIPDVETAGSIPIAIEFAKIQQQFDKPITLMLGGPFTAAGNICEVDLLCRWLLKKPETAHLLIKKVTQFLKNLADFFWEKFPGQHMSAFQGEPTGANQIVSPKQFEEFILPYYIDLNEYVLNKGFDRIFCHICGEQNLNLEHWTKIPFGDPGMLSFGHEVDLTKAIEMFGDKHIIMGNVEPRVIQEGTWQEVYELSKQCIEKAKYAPSGYVLMAGCDVPVMAPPYNLYIMKKAVMDFGFY